MSAKNLKTPYECPAVGVELGGGCVDLCEEFPLEGRERQAHPNAFKYRLVHEKERVPLPRCVVYANGFPRPAGTDGNMRIMGAEKSIKIVQVGITAMVLQVFHGRQSGALA